MPTTDLLNRYHESLYVRHRRSRAVREVATAARYSRRRGVGRPHARHRALSLPEDLPKVAAKGGGRYCKELGLPNVAARVPCRRSSSPMSAPTRAQYGNQGILLNSDGLKNWLFGPIDGPPRNTAQIGMPG